MNTERALARKDDDFNFSDCSYVSETGEELVARIREAKRMNETMGTKMPVLTGE